MRILCDACESAPAIVFCAADEAALCRACDEKVHMCNKLASRHVRVGLANPSDVPRCDICEYAPGMQFLGDIAVDRSVNGIGQNQPAKPTIGENQQNHKIFLAQMAAKDLNTDTKIDLNMNPHRMHEQA
ncbi:B-box zinc finger protein 18 [Hibiscus syriacus]|uniref:B-box zinc finger protein 18 n=1 Tax=Hibiscus syriacus TaxID=106335 RepID=A0A6A3B2C2_HIBSY|nr:B-box zinc finger protein 18 [Hibiscus syriacus]